jgi:uncharacterized membrane protein YdjX (TVP38/TMEM64 family)
MKPALRAALFLAVLFAIPIVPVVWLGDSFEESLLKLLRDPSSPQIVATWVVGLLAADMFLPVPSSAVITYAGGVLGLTVGTIASWLGLSLGGLGGFALARTCGEPLARRFSEPDDIARMSQFTQRYGATAILLTRALPILAEACVLMLGCGRLSWRQFLVPLLVSNLLLSLAYSACGAVFQGSASFVVAIVGSGAVPLIAAVLIRRWWRPSAK